MVSALEEYKSAIATLERAGNDNAAYDAAELFEKAFGVSVHSAKAQRLSENEGLLSFKMMINKRAEGFPLQYILGEWEFYGITVKVGEGVLIPRQDTETLVETVIKKNRNKSPVIVDLCSGSGCIALALEGELSPREIYAVEKSERAAVFLNENIKLNGSKIKPVIGDCLDKSATESLPPADIIVCNPPYLTKEDMESLQREVTFEPEEALFGGEDGLDFYRDITRAYKLRLNHNGMLAFEVGYTQAEEVMEILIQAGFEDVRTYEDYCGVKRVVIGFYTEKGNVKVY